MQESCYLEGTDALIEKFRNLPFLATLDRRYIKEILQLSKLRRYTPGESITTEGCFDCWIYMLISGSVRVLIQNNEIAVIDRIGDTFGELAVIDGASRSATIEAITDTVCLATDVSFIDRLSPADHSAFSAVYYRLFAEIVAQRLRDTSEELARTKKELERLKKRKSGK
ncbi:MAG: cyclic nucleotide-binding domain-containing protein [Desulfobulbaceae bacterium]|nr:cyclic nucleotide-binding domain-containing protein [Desulfobulbaceae bacterium]